VAHLARRLEGGPNLARVVAVVVVHRGALEDAEELEPAMRADLVDRLAAAGLKRIEAASFVNPKVVPQMAGAEEVMAALSEFHHAMGRRILEYQGTLERFTGDGLMVLFNDPLPLHEPARKAVEMAFVMQEDALKLAAQWKKKGYTLGLGIGISQGYATVGAIGFEGRIDYGAIGTVTNLASRLCDLAEPGHILVSQRVFAEVEESVFAEDIGEVPLHGFKRPVRAFRLLDFKGLPE